MRSRWSHLLSRVDWSHARHQQPHTLGGAVHAMLRSVRGAFLTIGSLAVMARLGS
jgi:hypothetical protein